MYNEEIKKRYILEKESTTNTPVGYLNNLFSRAADHEMRLGKDISSFTVHEIVDFYKILNLTSQEMLVVMNSHLSLYTDWCLKQNLVFDCQNHFFEINHDLLQTCINTVAIKRSIYSRAELYNKMEGLLNPSDAFVMLAVFEGIRGQDSCEIFNLKMSDFNGNKVKLCTGREITVSDDLVQLAKKSNETMEYYAVSNGSQRIYRFLEEDLIVKNMYNAVPTTDAYVNGQRIYRRLQRNFEYLGIKKWMKISSLETSGMIDYVNTRCKELNISAFEFLYSDYVCELDDKYSSNVKRIKASWYRKYKGYLV